MGLRHSVLTQNYSVTLKYCIIHVNWLSSSLVSFTQCLATSDLCEGGRLQISYLNVAPPMCPR